jgi:hypothetical protein
MGRPTWAKAAQPAQQAGLWCTLPKTGVPSRGPGSTKGSHLSQTQQVRKRAIQAYNLYLQKANLLPHARGQLRAPSKTVEAIIKNTWFFEGFASYVSSARALTYSTTRFILQIVFFFKTVVLQRGLHTLHLRTVFFFKLFFKGLESH